MKKGPSVPPYGKGAAEGKRSPLGPEASAVAGPRSQRADWQPEQPPSASAGGRSRGRRASSFQGAPSEAGRGGRDPEPGQASSWVEAEALELGGDTMEGRHPGLKFLKHFVLCRVLYVQCFHSGSGPAPDVFLLSGEKRCTNIYALP